MKFFKKLFCAIILLVLSLCVQIRAIQIKSSHRHRESFYQEDDYELSTTATPSSFDSTDIYQKLNFQANWTKFKLYWKSRDFDFEERYLREQTCYTRSSCQLAHIQVFVVPFSHNDPGWLKTFEEYFNTKTKFVLDNAVDKLSQYEDMTFVWSEISFLSKWWNTVANVTQKRMMKKLLSEGRLEILTGGWSFRSNINQSSKSYILQNWLRRNLNYKPKAAWSIDPFGHGSAMPYLLKNSGMEGMMIQRLHYAWKHWLAEHKYGDFYWNQQWDSSGQHSIHCLNAPYDLYPTKHSCGPTPEECMRFNFRNLPGHSNEEQLMYMKPVTEQNILDLADRLVGQYRRTASLTRHNVVVTGVGNDFEFNDPLEWDQQYRNYQKLFHFINSNPQRYNAKIQFGTLSQYFQTVKESNAPLPNFQGDFFPYSDVYFPYPPAYWTGYYSTRPFWKKLSRETEDELRKAEVLFTFTLNFLRQNNYTEETQMLEQTFNYLVQARRWLALFQHHDGITGTSPRPTMIDYAKKLFDAIRFSEYIQSACVKLLIRRQNSAYINDVGETFANLADQVPLKLTQVDTDTAKKVVIFNSLGWNKSHLVRVLLDSTDVMVFGPAGEQIMAQINPKIGVTDQGEPGIFAGYYEIVFIAYLPPFSLITYEIRRAEENRQKLADNHLAVPAAVQCKNCPYHVEKIEYPYISISNDQTEVVVDADNGLLKRINRKFEQVSTVITASLGKYPATYGSGAYLSRPNTEFPVDIMADCKRDNATQLYVISGPVIQEITMICKEIMISTYLLQYGYSEALSAVYLTNSVKPTTTGVNHGEFFMSFESDLDTTEQHPYNNVEEPVFYTDNGLSPQKRMRVSRLPYEGNLYPVVNYAFIQDKYSKRRFSVLVDRAHGFTSSKSGHIETIFDRRLPYDDARGMDEGVNDPEDMVSNYILLLEPLPSAASHENDHTGWSPTLTAQRASKFLNHQPSLFVYDHKRDPYNQQSRNMPISLFTKEFPPDVNSTLKSTTQRLGSDLKLYHFAESSDLVGDFKPNANYADDNNYEIKSGALRVLKSFELMPYTVHF